MSRRGARKVLVARFARAVLFASSVAAELRAADGLVHGIEVGSLLWHVASCALLGWVASIGLHGRGRERWLRGGFAFVIGASLPCVGLLGAGALLAMSRSGRPRSLAVVQLSRPDWSDSSAASAELAARMLASSRSTAQRVHVLLSQRGMPAATAVPGLRAALRDPREEVRLLAHALLDRRETRMRIAIADREAELQSPDLQAGRRWQLLRRLAYSHWAIVDGELAQGELALHALARASSFAQAALALRADGELCLQLVQAHLRAGDGMRAWSWLQRAERAGVPCETRAPLYAEAAFHLHHFEQVPRWLRRAGRQLWRPNLRRVAALWMQVERNSRSRGPRHP